MSARTALLTLFVLAVAARPALAQRACYPIAPGETAARLAQRLTGDPLNRHAPWFHIVDRHLTAVARTDQAVLQPDWLACLDRGQRPIVLSRGPAPLTTPRSREQWLHPLAVLEASMDFTFLLVAAFILGALSLSRLATSFARRRRERALLMRRFGTEFVREFGRPLTQFRGGSPLPRARLRISPRRSRVEVLLAPANGRSYPNLSDHRGNVEYDVARVMATLRRESFVKGPPYAEGPWVVLPFQLRGPVKQGGVR